MTTPFPFTPGQVLTAAQLNAITTLPINDQTASYVALVGDVGKRIVMNVATANTVTINNTVFATGDTIFIANKGAGATTVTAGAGVTINSASGLDLVTSQSGQLVALSASSFLFVATSTNKGRLLQVVTTTKTDTFSASVATTANTAVTGLSVTITPSSASSQILVVGSVMGAVNQIDSTMYLFLLRASTPIGVGASPGSRQAITSSCVQNQNSANITSGSFVVLDSPATTSATTYSVNVGHNSGGTRTLLINRSEVDTNAATFARAVSTITVFEVSA